MKFPISGASYIHPSVDVNYQRCMNMFPVDSGPQGLGSPSCLLPTDGLELCYNLGADAIRGMIAVGNVLYVVLGTSVYKITFDLATEVATPTLLGSIVTQTSKVWMAANPTQILIVDGSSAGYIITIATDALAAIADGDFLGGDVCVFVDGYFFVNNPGTGQFYCSQLNDGTAWDALDIATAESSTDDIVSLGVVKGELWVLGEHSTEIWYNAANASGMPFSLRQGLTMNIGCGAKDSAVQINDLLIWMDDRGFIVQSDVANYVRDNNTGYNLKIISTEALTSEILSYSTRSDAVACTYSSRGHLMYQITFPTVNKTWVYDLTSNGWHERGYWNQGEGVYKRHKLLFVKPIGQLWVGGGDFDGKLYYQKSDVYEDNGDVIRRLRTIPYFNSEMNLVGVDRLDIKAETGRVVGPDTAEINMSYSVDGGHTWSNSMSRSLGDQGQYALPITWNRLGIGRSWLFMFIVTSDVFFSLIEAYINVSEVED